MNFLFLFASILCYSLINAQCAQPATSTNTINPPVLNTTSSSFVNNILTIGFDWGITQTGVTPTRTLIPAATFGLVGSCTATPTSISGTSDACFNAQEVSYNFNSLTTTCGWARLSTGPLLDQYGGSLTLVATETYVDIRGATQTRTLTYTMQLQVTFPTTATSSTSVTIASSVVLDVFVNSQIYVKSTNLATLVFTTVVGYPYKVSIIPTTGATATAVTGTDVTGFSAVVSVNGGTSTIATTTGQVSNQLWDLTITPTVGTSCYYTGSYNLAAVFVIECALATPSDCPTIANNSVPVTLNVASENFCFIVAEVVPVFANLTSYKNAALTITETNFLTNDFPVQLSYFKMNVSSTAVTITTQIGRAHV